MKYLSPNAEAVLTGIMDAWDVIYTMYDIPGFGLLVLPADVGMRYIDYFNQGYEPRDAFVLGANDAFAAALLGEIGGDLGAGAAKKISGKLGLPGKVIGGLLGSDAGERLAGAIGKELLPPPLDGSKNKFDDAKGSFSPYDPLIFDLNGDGVHTTTLTASSAFFDIDNDGFAERTEWASGNDGMLVIDANNNGFIDDVSELFGDDVFANGIAKLQSHDLNADNIIDANDAVFSQLQIWRDANENGISDEGELQTLTDWNIASISLSANDGQISFTFADGTQGVAENRNFSVDQMQTYYTGEVTLDADIVDLPWLRGYGEVKDMIYAMSEDDDLKSYVADLATSSDLATLDSKIDTLLAKWTGADSISESAMRGQFSARKLAILEQFMGQDFTMEMFTMCRGNKYFRQFVDQRQADELSKAA